MRKDDYDIVMEREFKSRNKLIDERKEINELIEQIDERILRVKIKYLFDNLLLSKIVWYFNWFSYSLTASTCDKDYASDEIMKEVMDLFDVNFHCEKEIEPGIKLRFDDGTMSLYFSTPDKMVGFIEKYNIVVDIESAEKRVNELDKLGKQTKRDLRSFKALLKKIKKRQDNGI